MTFERKIEPRVLSRSDAAAYCGIGTTLFDEMVSGGRLPKPSKFNNRTVWDRHALDAALDGLFASGGENEFDRLCGLST